MGKSLAEIVEKLKSENKKTQLIYGFNSNGKTRLSREFKKIIEEENDLENGDEKPIQVLYYNAFTEDLFYWDNDLEYDEEPKLKIQPNSFTKWIFEDQGKEQNIIAIFQHYTNDKLTPNFNEEYALDENGEEKIINAFSEVTFSFERGNENERNNIKISKGEESNLIWSVFYSLIEQVIDVLNTPEIDDRDTDQFNELKYIFIDDPVTSLDENHLIELAVDLAKLINSSNSELKFIITTHNAIFYNVLLNELSSKKSYMLDKLEDGTFELNEKRGDSNRSFSYHLYLIEVIKKAIEENNIQKFHFMLLRNLYEKTASFLGYQKWSELLPEDGRKGYIRRIITFSSHSTLSTDTVADPTPPEKEMVNYLLNHLIENYKFRE